MRFIFIFLLMILSSYAFAQDATPYTPGAPVVAPPAAKPAAPVRDVPEITYGQKVEIVVEAKRNPVILNVSIDQQKEGVSILIVVDNNVDRELAKKLAWDLVMLTKAKTLDDRPTDMKDPGKGLYNYGVRVLRVDQVVLLTAHKMATEAPLMIDPPVMSDLPVDVRPLTRGDGKP